MAGLDRSLDDIIQSSGAYGKAPRRQNQQASNRSRPFGGGSRQQQQESRKQSIGDELDANVTFPATSIKVSATGDPKEIAARLTETILANEETPALLTIGNHSINQAVKAMAIARQELLSHGFDLSFQPAFRHSDRTKPLIAFYLAHERTQRNAEHQFDGEEELTVTSHGKITPVAGAIAGKTRDGVQVGLAAIGVDAVTNAVLAVGSARLFLEGDSMDITVRPEFTKVPKNGETYTCLKLHIISEVL